MDGIDIEPPYGPEMAPLYEKDRDQFEPWRAYMTLSQEGYLRFGRSFDNGHSFEVRLGTTQMWYIPSNLSHDELIGFATELVPLFKRVISGLCVDWDERIDHERGELLPDAEEASLQIQSACDDLMERAHHGSIGTSILEPWEIFQYDDLDDYGLHKNSTDKEIRKVAGEEMDNRRSNGEMVYGSIFEFLKEWIAESA